MEDFSKGDVMETYPGSASRSVPPAGGGVPRVIVSIFLILLILGGGGAGAYLFIKTKPGVERKPATVSAPLVRCLTAGLDDHQVEVETMGTVRPSLTVTLKPQVGGVVASLAPQCEPGGYVAQGTPLVIIDREDYEFVRRQRTNDLIVVQSELAQEMGRQAVAAEEVNLLGSALGEGDRHLAMRAPQLNAIQARLASARTALDQAELNLKRTEVKAPMACVVADRFVAAGAVVNSATVLAELIGTETYWIEITIPVDHLPHVTLPGTDGGAGSEARVYYRSAWGEGVWRRGRVICMLPELAPQGRQARLLVAVDDPLCLQPGNATLPKLIVNAYVQVVIEGMTMREVAAVPAAAVHDGRRIWVIGPDNTLAIRPVSVAWRSRDTVFISEGIKAGDRVIVSDLSAPVHGMQVKPVEENGVNPESAESDSEQRKAADE